MKEFKGTKGEWKVGKVPEYNDVLKSAMIEIQSDNVWICKVQNNGVIENKEGQYNALIMSKAPEILEMLIDLRNCKETWSDLFQSDKDRIELLIREATEL